jgi:PAS domain S-box-containing protein
MAQLIVPEHLRGAHTAGMKRYLAGSPSRVLNQRLELEAINSRGEIFPIELTIAEIKMENHKFFSAFIRDITVQREADLELKMAARAFDTQEAIFITDEQSKIMRVNLAFQRLTGYSAQEAYGMSSAELIVPSSPEHEPGQSWQDLLDAHPYAGESRVQPKSAAAFPVRLIISEILGEKGDVTHRVAHFSDITEQKEYEKKLTKARQDAEYANRAKTRFLASMSHEIRTPLNAVINLNSLLLKTSLDGDQSRLARAANEGGKTLLNLIEGILDLAEIEAGKMSIDQKQFNLHELLREIVRLFEQQAIDKNLRLELNMDKEVPHWIEGDPDRMRQILVNLVGNSIKFTEEGYIELDVSTNPEKNTIFSVIDTGPGIDTEASQFLFDEFFQADSGYARRHAGSGLGLTISKKLATMMHGNIEWAARDEGGSVFTLTLPLIGVPAPGKPPKMVDDETRFSGHILVVEDQEPNRLVMDELLSRLGLDVSMAEDGQQAIDTVKSDESIDLVLMDVSMPVLDGIEATKMIRKLPGACRDMVIVAMTANAFAEDRDRCLASGMNDFLAKPIDSMRLSKCIGRWLAGANDVPDSAVVDAPDDSRVSLGELHDERVTNRLREITELVAALSEKAPEVIANAAHAIKSSAATFGATELAVRARRVENKARAGELSRLDGAVERIGPVLKQTVLLYTSRFLTDVEGGGEQ